MPFILRAASSVREMSSVASNIAKSLRSGEGSVTRQRIAPEAPARTADQCASLQPAGGAFGYRLPDNGVRLNVVGAPVAIRSRVVVADDDVLLREGLASL